MIKFSSRLVLAAALTLGATTPFLTPTSPSIAHAAAQDQELALVEQLKTDAFKALRDGKFNVVNDLLSRAATVSKDPAVERMAAWTTQFESQRAEFAAERRKQYDKSVGQVHLLQREGYQDYAIDAAKEAYLLAEDKAAFRAEPWVDELVKKTITMAEQYEQNEEWLRALRLYSDLSAVEPANPVWKERLKTATRRIRLLALYTPEELKAVQKSEAKTREAVDKLLRPEAATQPTTQAAADEAADDQASDELKIDWRDSLRDVKMTMLWNALVNARANYWRDVNYRDLMVGGLKGMQTLATTRGLEKAFPGLADQPARDRFLAVVNESLETARRDESDDPAVIWDLLFKKLATANKESVKIPDEVLVSEFADGAFAELDPFTSMIWPSEWEDFNTTTQGKFSGVGIQIESDADRSLRVVTPIEDTPAYKAGIRENDVITKINGKAAKGLSLNQAVKLIKGPPGTYVALTVRTPAGETKELNLRRETIKVSSIKGWTHRPGGGWDYLIDPDSKIAYVRCTNFTSDTKEDLDRAVDEIQQAGGRGIILDLRYNPGGLLTAATQVVDKFLDKGVIVSTHADRETPQQPTVATAKRDADEVKLPVVVLVNQYSASASEIVSGALKDQGRAVVVGERTFGKGSVQMLFEMAGKSAYLKLTTSHYYLPSGRCIHREENSTEWGVDPDVTIEMTPEQMRAAIKARQEQDVLRDAVQATPAEGKQEQLQDKIPAIADKVADARDKEADKRNKDPLACDPQLSAALLMLRLQLAGAPM